MKKGLTVTVLVLAALGLVAQARAEENLGSAENMAPLCKAWLKLTIDRDFDAIKNTMKIEPMRFTTSGMCAGEVIGIMEAMRAFELSCPPDGVSNEQLVRMVIGEIDKHPERLNEDFVVPAAAVMLATWPCRK
jgi:hypothetical protein